jgi:2-isopropylmalate synthase
MDREENIKYALLATELNVDVIEAGFPSASLRDFEIVNEIATILSNNSSYPEIAALCQLREEQVTKTMEALSPAVKNNKALVHIYVPVSPELMESSLGKKADKIKIIENAGKFISLAVQKVTQNRVLILIL